MNWLAIIEKLKEVGGLTSEQIAAMEKRGSWRVARKVGLFGFFKDGEKIDLLAVNFGPGGLKLEAPRRLKVKEELMLRVARKNEKPQMLSDKGDDVAVRVVWCKRRKDLAGYEMGVIFTGTEVNGALAAARFLLEDCGVSIRSPREKRGAPRTQADDMTGIFSTADGQMTQVKVHDLAVGGALLESPRSVEVGLSINVKIFLSKDAAALDCKGSIVRNRIGARAKTFELAVAFTGVPSDHKDRLVRFLSKRLKFSND